VYVLEGLVANSGGHAAVRGQHALSGWPRC